MFPSCGSLLHFDLFPPPPPPQAWAGPGGFLGRFNPVPLSSTSFAYKSEPEEYIYCVSTPFLPPPPPPLPAKTSWRSLFCCDAIPTTSVQHCFHHHLPRMQGKIKPEVDIYSVSTAFAPQPPLHTIASRGWIHHVSTPLLRLTPPSHVRASWRGTLTKTRSSSIYSIGNN